ncbi:MAG: hypothetical protein U1E51_31715 [Candidatus Binatia bacterium]|nr:hypothetical protein [Candidatus Binatia bacterium]
MLRCAQSPRYNVLAKYASARRIFARLAFEIFLSSLQEDRGEERFQSYGFWLASGEIWESAANE